MREVGTSTEQGGGRGRGGVRRGLLLVLATVSSCTCREPSGSPRPARSRPEAFPGLEHRPLREGEVRMVEEELPVEDHWLMRLDTLLRFGHRPATAQRLHLSGADGSETIAHYLRPEGPGPHPALLVLPILGGTHLVSELVALRCVREGYAVLRIERRGALVREHPVGDLANLCRSMRATLLDARRLLDWLESRPEVDPERLGVFGVSMGGMLAATLMGVDARLRAGVLVMAGSGLDELLYDSSEEPVRAFRDRLRATEEWGGGPGEERARFLARVGPSTDRLDPARYAAFVDRRQVCMISGRFDSVVPPRFTRRLWDQLGRPRWHRFPCGHYSMLAFLGAMYDAAFAHLDPLLKSGEAP